MIFKTTAALTAMLATVMGSPTGTPGATTTTDAALEARNAVPSARYDFASLAGAPSGSFRWLIGYTPTAAGGAPCATADADGEPSFKVVCEGPIDGMSIIQAFATATAVTQVMPTCTAVSGSPQNPNDAIHTNVKVYAAAVPSGAQVQLPFKIPFVGGSPSIPLPISNGVLAVVHAFTVQGSITSVKFAAPVTPTAVGGLATATANDYAVGTNYVMSYISTNLNPALSFVAVRAFPTYAAALETRLYSAIPAAVTASVSGLSP